MNQALYAHMNNKRKMKKKKKKCLWPFPEHGLFWETFHVYFEEGVFYVAGSSWFTVLFKFSTSFLILPG
jgi:hypothetical protein